MKVLFRAVRSRRKFVNSPKVKAEIERVLDREVKPDLIKQFERVVSDWKNKPEFKARKSISANGVKIYVYPAGPNKKIWFFVSGGTKPHTIRPKNAHNRLFFPAGPYQPKTRPGGFYGGPGIAPGPTVAAKAVQHPGTEAREFEKVIAKDYKNKFRRNVENAFRRGLRG